MYLKRSSHKITIKTIMYVRGFLMAMGLMFVFFLLLSGNKLIISKNYEHVAEKVRNRLIANDNVSVASIHDVYLFSKGALSGLITPNPYSSLAIEIPHNTLLQLTESASGSLDRKSYQTVSLQIIEPSGLTKMKAKVRFKGDRELHSEKNNGASVRLNLKGNSRFLGMEKFSIQKPIIRNYSWEYFIADIFTSEQLLTLQQGPINYIVNGEKLGIYSYEEVPSANTIERQNRKSGPIFGLDENYGVGISPILDIYDKDDWANNELAQVAESLLYSQFQLAEAGQQFSGDVFDLDEWAKYFALHDVFGSYHGTVLKSVKYYYNPVLGKFQPLLFDAHKGAGKFKDFGFIDFLLNPNTAKCEWICDQKEFYLAFLGNPQFIKLYTKYLNKYTSLTFFDRASNLYENKFRSLDNEFYANFSASDAILARGFGLYLFKVQTLKNRMEMLIKKMTILASNGMVSPNVQALSHKSQKSNFFIKEPFVSNVFEFENLNLNAKEWRFTTPTLVVLSGETVLIGSEDDPLMIWGPVMFVQNEGEIIMENVVFHNPTALNVSGRNWSGSVNILGASARLINLTIINAKAEDALNIVSSDFEIETLKVHKAQSDAFDSDFSNGKITSLECRDIGNDCLDTSGSNIDLKFLYAANVMDKAVSAGEKSSVKIESVVLENLSIGIVSKDGSNLEVSDYRSNDVALDFAIFNKKEEYGNPNFVLKTINHNSRPLNGFVDGLAIIDLPAGLTPTIKSSKEIENLLYGAVYGTATKKP